MFATFIKNELPLERILVTTLGDDGDKNIYTYILVFLQFLSTIFDFLQIFLVFDNKSLIVNDFFITIIDIT